MLLAAKWGTISPFAMKVLGAGESSAEAAGGKRAGGSLGDGRSCCREALTGRAMVGG